MPSYNLYSLSPITYFEEHGAENGVEMKSYIITIFILLLTYTTSAYGDTINYVDATALKHNPNNKYFVELLAKALKTSEPEFGKFELRPIDVLISQERQLKELNKGTIDVFWTMNTAIRAQAALPIKIPLIKGAYGLRRLVINKLDQSMFSTLNSREDLAKKIAILGKDWPDAAILRANEFSINTEAPEHSLYNVIANEREFYFPRAITEAWSELNSLNNNQLTIDTKHLLQYPTAVYFFVAKNNKKLAARIEAGLKEMSKTGQLDELFYTYPLHQLSFADMDLSNVEIYQLNNPLMVDASEKAVIKQAQNEILKHIKGLNRQSAMPQ